MIEALAILFARCIADLIEAGDDADKQEAALMTAVEEIARIRARRKFGG